MKFRQEHQDITEGEERSLVDAVRALEQETNNGLGTDLYRIILYLDYPG